VQQSTLVILCNNCHLFLISRCTVTRVKGWSHAPYTSYWQFKDLFLQLGTVTYFSDIYRAFCTRQYYSKIVWCSLNKIEISQELSELMMLLPRTLKDYHPLREKIVRKPWIKFTQRSLQDDNSSLAKEGFVIWGTYGLTLLLERIPFVLILGSFINDVTTIC